MIFLIPWRNFMHSVFKLSKVLLIVVAAACAWAASDKGKSQADDAKTVANPDADKIFYQEAKLIETMHKFTPMVETYIQNLKPDNELGSVPDSDKYFLGRLVLNDKGINDTVFDKRGPRSILGRVVDRLNDFYKMNYVPAGFMQLIFLNYAFDKDHYDLKFLREQFLGEVRTKVYDVVPKPHFKGAHFVGRIWVEDKDFNIVRLNGTYEPQTRSNYYFHFDSWRMNLQPGLWLPVYTYTEESDASYAMFRRLAMKGQTRLWGYDLKHSGTQSDYTNVKVEAADATDKSAQGDNEFVPVQSQHLWEREAEDNLLDRMERAGIMAPDGEVSKVMQTVVNNLEITNKLNIEPEVRCRVLLTTPLESFTIGHTIVISRGLLDVLPDEASLAMVLAHNLAHITLGHSLDTKYAFSDRMIFQDEDVFRRIRVRMSEHDEEIADQKGLELLQNSPYKDKEASAGLFLKALEQESRHLGWLINPRYGNKLTEGETVRMGALAQSAPQLETGNVSQLPALPLGSRIKLDPWDDHVEMKKSKPVGLLSARDKMSFEVTPMFPNLIRYNGRDELAKDGNR
jgi:Zn-dependent protease with chaperone function